MWDRLGGSGGADEATWAAVESLHARGKGKIPEGTLPLPPMDPMEGGKRALKSLKPSRRLHKICKGRRLSARSDAAAPHLPRALEWVGAQASTEY